MSPRFSCREAGRWAGRVWSRSVSRGGGRGAVGCLLGRCGLFSLVVVNLSVPLYQFPGRFPIFGGRFQGVLGCLPRVRSRSILCVSVRSCSSRSAFSSRGAVRLSARSSVPCVSSWRRCGGGRLLACPFHCGYGAGDVATFRPVLVSRLFATGSGEAGCRVECLVLLAWSRCQRRCAVSRACPGCPCDCLSPCRSMRRVSDEMRAMAAAVCYQMPVLVLLACRFVSPRSSTRGTGGEAERAIMSGSEMLDGWAAMWGRRLLLGVISCGVG